MGFSWFFAKVRWGCLLGLFGCFSLVCGWFWRGGGHFRTARSGVYMVIGETDSVIRFGFLDEWGDAHFSGLGLNPLPRLSTRCRGAPRRRGRSGRVWDLVFDRLAYKKPEAPMPCSSFGCRLTHRRSGGLPSDCSFGLRPRRTRLFCFTAR